MKKTNYEGIDYSGPGSTANRDEKTGIRYGIIHTNDLMPEACEDIYSRGTDMDFEDYMEEAKARIRKALEDYFSNFKWQGEKSKLDLATEEAFEAIRDSLSDNYTGSDGCARYMFEDGELKVMTDSSGDLWVLKSPCFTYAQFCSPCAPGACHLASPLDRQEESNKCYCLPADWFSKEEPCPYDIYSVETGEKL